MARYWGQLRPDRKQLLLDLAPYQDPADEQLQVYVEAASARGQRPIPMVLANASIAHSALVAPAQAQLVRDCISRVSSRRRLKAPITTQYAQPGSGGPDQQLLRLIAMVLALRRVGGVLTKLSEIEHTCNRISATLMFTIEIRPVIRRCQSWQSTPAAASPACDQLQITAAPAGADIIK